MISYDPNNFPGNADLLIGTPSSPAGAPLLLEGRSFSVPAVVGLCGLGVKPFYAAGDQPVRQTPASRFFLVLFAVSVFVAAFSPRSFAQRPDKDYLSAIEADKIRDAESTNDRIKLFVTYAEDRLTKFKYELEHPSSNKHGEMLNYLMNSYIGCVDDAADLIQLGLEKQDNIRQGIDLMASKAPDFLQALKNYSQKGPELEIYKENLDDAIEGTEDALREAEAAKKKAAPPPVRRRN
jgi:hypothetical protein